MQADPAKHDMHCHALVLNVAESSKRRVASSRSAPQRGLPQNTSSRFMPISFADVSNGLNFV
eukprot:4202643-Pyramimonas_sp.AAC.2